MPAIVTCPSCARSLSLPEEQLGATVRCPACATDFETKEPGSKAVTAQLPRVPDANQGPDASLDGEKEPCPACGADIPMRLLRCPECGTDLEYEDDRPWERSESVRRDWDPHRGALILTLGVGSIVLSCTSICCSIFGLITDLIALGMGIAAWMMGRTDLPKMEQRAMDPDGYGSTQAGKICGIIGTIFSCLFGVGLLAIVAFWGSMMVGMRANMVPPPPPAAQVQGVQVKAGVDEVPAGAGGARELLPPPRVEPLAP